MPANFAVLACIYLYMDACLFACSFLGVTAFFKASVRQAHPGQELDTGASHQLVVADRPGGAGSVVVKVPVRPSPVLAFVVHQLE